MKEYLTVKGWAREEIEIKHSKFIATATHVASREEATNFLAVITKEFSDATHNCYAYCADSLGRELKFSDNGEPSGTAGQPILDVIQKTGLREIAIVVTRYFGGIKLGANGLVGAYSQSAAKVVRSMTKILMKPSVLVKLEFPYTYAKKCEMLPFSHDGIITEREFTDKVNFKVSLPCDNIEKFASAFSELTKGQGLFEVVGEIYREVVV